MISAIVPTSSTVFAVFAGPDGEVIFSRVQCWAVTDLVQQEGNQLILVGRAVTGIALREGQLCPCNGQNVLDFVGYDEKPAPWREDGTPDPAPWVEKCAARRKAIQEEKAKAKASPIVIPNKGGVPDATWSNVKDLRALRSPDNPLD